MHYAPLFHTEMHFNIFLEGWSWGLRLFMNPLGGKGNKKLPESKFFFYPFLDICRNTCMSVHRVFKTFIEAFIKIFPYFSGLVGGYVR